MYPGIKKLEACTSVVEVNDSIISSLAFGMADLRENGAYIFGAGKLGKNVRNFLLSEGIEVRGFIDNSQSLQREGFLGHEVAALSAVPFDAIIYIGSATYLNEISKQLHTAGYRKICSHMQAGILFFGNDNFPIDMYLRDMIRDLVENKERYIALFDGLADEKSKTVLDSLVHFRLTFDLTFIDQVVSPYHSEYFEPGLVESNGEEVFYDAGGFDGDTAQKFIHWCSARYSTIHIFEPDAVLISKARVRLAGHPNIYYNPVGVYDRETLLRFNETGGLDGAISESGEIEIRTVSIDGYSHGRPAPTFIKFDVEGAEIEAINGASEVIAGCHPKLAVSAYHIPRHLWEIPDLVLGKYNGYKVYIRHYTKSVFDTIIYFV